MVTLSNYAIATLIIAALWDVCWKMIAAWRAVHNQQKGWFVVLLVINSVGLLPIYYLLTHKTAPARNTS